MNRRLTLISRVLPGILIVGCSQRAVEPSPDPVKNEVVQVRLVELQGQSCDAFSGQENCVSVFTFVRTDCPIANRYAPELQRLQEQYAPRGVEWTLVYPDPDETAEMIQAHCEEFGFQCRALRDPEHQLVRLTQATVAPEVAVFNTQRQLVYCGRIDDRFVDFGQTRPEPTVHDLVDALEATLSGRAVARARTKAVGCLISDLQ